MEGRRLTFEKHWAGKEREVLEWSFVQAGILEEAKAAWDAIAATKNA